LARVSPTARMVPLVSASAPLTALVPYRSGSSTAHREMVC
jgi:hypothetical protein